MSAPVTWRVRPACEADIAAAYQLLARNGWGHRIGTPAQFSALVQASQRAVVADANGAVVGFARAITDGSVNAYLSMLVVAPEQRRRGIGRALVAQLMGDDTGITWLLRAGRDSAREFFAALGFRDSAVAMERCRGGGADAVIAPRGGPVAAVLVHVDDVAAGLAWYRRAFAQAQHVSIAVPAFECLAIDGVRLEIVRADEKLSSGASGSVVYWRVADLDAALARFQSLGATLYRGPMAIEAGLSMCQVRDPWGNCIGLRGPRREGGST